MTSQPSSSSFFSLSPTSSLPPVTLLRIKECFGYMIRRSDGNYYCESWGLDKPTFTGELLLLSQENFIKISLISKESGEKFSDSIELDCTKVDNPTPLSSFFDEVKDSSRYFVIRLRDPSSGRALPFGIGFRERNDSFDFRAAIRDKINSVRRQEGIVIQSKDKEKEGESNASSSSLSSYSSHSSSSNHENDNPSSSSSIPPIDFGDLRLPDDHRIVINSGFVSKSSTKSAKPKSSTSSSSPSSTPFLLAPPPEFVESQESDNNEIVSPVGKKEKEGEEDDWGDFSSGK